MGDGLVEPDAVDPEPPGEGEEVADEEGGELAVGLIHEGRVGGREDKKK